jgi:GT2 family glycosyltransferase
MFDPGYFMYFDDWDFCERVRDSGFKILYTPEGRVWHKVSVSTQKDAKPSKWWYVLGKSTVRFYLRHRRPILLTMPGHVVWITARELAKKNIRGVPAYWKGIKDGFLARDDQYSIGAAFESTQGALSERTSSGAWQGSD